MFTFLHLRRQFSPHGSSCMTQMSSLTHRKALFQYYLLDIMLTGQSVIDDTILCVDLSNSCFIHLYLGYRSAVNVLTGCLTWNHRMELMNVWMWHVTDITLGVCHDDCRVDQQSTRQSSRRHIRSSFHVQMEFVIIWMVHPRWSIPWIETFLNRVPEWTNVTPFACVQRLSVFHQPLMP